MLRLGFGVLWIFDGILQGQQSTPLGLPSQVIQPAAASSPGWVQHSELGRAGMDLSSGRRRAAAVWGLIVWVFGEAFGAGGAIGVALTGGARAVAVTEPGAGWRPLPPLPAGAAGVPAAAATLAARPGTRFEALTAHGGQLSVWPLTAGGTGWEQVQVIRVAIPYGSSG